MFEDLRAAMGSLRKQAEVLRVANEPEPLPDEGAEAKQAADEALTAATIHADVQAVTSIIVDRVSQLGTELNGVRESIRKTTLDLGSMQAVLQRLKQVTAEFDAKSRRIEGLESAVANIEQAQRGELDRAIVNDVKNCKAELVRLNELVTPIQRDLERHTVETQITGFKKQYNVVVDNLSAHVDKLVACVNEMNSRLSRAVDEHREKQKAELEDALIKMQMCSGSVVAADETLHADIRAMKQLQGTYQKTLDDRLNKVYDEMHAKLDEQHTQHLEKFKLILAHLDQIDAVGTNHRERLETLTRDIGELGEAREKQRADHQAAVDASTEMSTKQQVQIDALRLRLEAVDELLANAERVTQQRIKSALDVYTQESKASAHERTDTITHVAVELEQLKQAVARHVEHFDATLAKQDVEFTSRLAELQQTERAVEAPQPTEAVAAAQDMEHTPTSPKSPRWSPEECKASVVKQEVVKIETREEATAVAVLPLPKFDPTTTAADHKPTSRKSARTKRS